MMSPSVRVRFGPLPSLVFSAVVAACGGSTSSTSGAVTIAQACDDAARADCQRFAACSGTYVTQEFGSEAACEASFVDDCSVRLTLPGNANNAAHTEGCAQATSGSTCDDTSTPSACEQPDGALVAGESCAVAGQCLSGFCAISTSSSCGTCAASPGQGEACTPTNQCGQKLACAPDHTCVVPLGAGESCDSSGRCADGLRCQGTPSVCVTVDTTVAAGQACGVVGGKNVDCTDGTCQDGICVAYAKLGEACNRSTGPYCAGYGSYCISGTCTRPACG